ncbi:MAG: peptide chain release factor N(5)-glutamine methyltransferase [Paracoccaceae bacterium]
MIGTELLRNAIPRLKDAGVEDAVRDARLLLAHAMGVAADRLTLHLAEDVSADAVERFESLVDARVSRRPVSQILGTRMFWGRSFTVTGDVLDPRPETEILVAAALQQPFAKMLDLGTGSGCILLSCLLDMPMAVGMGTDISEAALEVARINAALLGLGARASFQLGDWCQGVRDRFDLIVSNPPYIAAHEMLGLTPEVRDWEPHLALTPGGDGLAAYRRIVTEASELLLSRGRLMVEIGPSQGRAVAAMFEAEGLQQVQIVKDFDDRDRVVRAIKSE